MSINKESLRKASVWISRIMFGLAACLFCLLIAFFRTLPHGHYSGGGGEGAVGYFFYITIAIALFVGVAFGVVARRTRTERRTEPYVVPRWCIRLIGPFSIVALFGVACAVPAVYLVENGPHHTYVDAKEGPLPGWEALLFGWCVEDLLDALPWLANLPWLAGMICLLLKKYRLALGFGVVASLLGLTTLYFFPPFGRKDHPLVGYYLWQSSLLALALAAWLGLAGARSDPIVRRDKVWIFSG